ncbi:MAG TPA: M28 family peptidase [Thermoleophilaceae bacterium]
MIEPRIYRAAFLPALLAIVIGMFSLENRPAPLPQGLAADVLFDGNMAVTGTRALVTSFPNRRPGTTGDLSSARSVAASFSHSGFDTRISHFEDSGKSLANVVGTRVGATRRQIVVIAARDAASVPDATGSAADTAALLEMARVLEGRATRKTLVLVSVDGSTLGSVGARHFLQSDADRGLVDGVIVLSNLAAERSRGPLLVTWGNDATRTGISLKRTLSNALVQELDKVPGDEHAFGQLVREAFPLGIGDQGPLVSDGLDAVRVSGSGELPPPHSERGVNDIDPNRVGSLGRGVLRAVASLDTGGKLRDGPHAYVVVGRKVLPGWSLAMLGFTLILPALVASIDAFARARRRRQAVGRWWRWVLAGSVPFLLGLVLAELLGLFGAAPDVSSSPVSPDVNPLSGGAWAQLAAVAAVIAAGWAFVRVPLIRRVGASGDPATVGAPCAAALLMSGLAVVTWLINPFAALFLLVPLHVWMLATLGPEDRRGAAPFLLVGLGFLPIALVALYYMVRLQLGPLDSLWYLYQLVAGHHIGFASALIGCLVLGVFGSDVSTLIARARRPLPQAVPAHPPIRGPGGHAGPGSLGGTRSAIRR